MELNEALQNKPYKWKWDTNVSRYERRASFKTKFRGHTLSYWVVFSKRGMWVTGASWSLTFRPSKAGMSVLFSMEQAGTYQPTPNPAVGRSYAILKTGYPFRKMATVIDILKSFLRDYLPDHIKFTSSGSEPSRTKLYTRLVSMVKTHIPGWTGVGGGDSPLGHSFYIYQPGHFPESAAYYYRSAGLPIPESVEAPDVVNAVVPVPVSPIHANEIASLSKETPCRS